MTRRRGSWLWRCQDPGAPHGANTGLERGPPEAVLLGPPKLRAFPDQLLRIQSDIPDRGWKQSSQRETPETAPPPHGSFVPKPAQPQTGRQDSPAGTYAGFARFLKGFLLSQTSHYFPGFTVE